MKLLQVFFVVILFCGCIIDGNFSELHQLLSGEEIESVPDTELHHEPLINKHLKHGEKEKKLQEEKWALFWNPFDSSVKKDPKKNEIFQTLKNGVSKDQQGFQSMKKELQMAQIVNNYKKRSFFKKNEINKDIIMSKREVDHRRRHNLTNNMIAKNSHLLLIPVEQPGCPWVQHGSTFYKVHEERRKDSSNNWVCEESFENKLKICISMFKTFTARKLNSTYELAEDEEPVNRECEEQPVTFFERPKNETEEDTFDKTEVTIGVWMFKCPITKIHLQFPRAQKEPPVHLIQDFYITKGKFDRRPIVAVLHKSKYIDNLCLRDIWIFDYTKIIPNYTPTWR